MPRRTPFLPCPRPGISPGSHERRYLSRYPCSHSHRCSLPSPTARTRHYRPRRLQHGPRPSSSAPHTAMIPDFPPLPPSRLFLLPALFLSALHFLRPSLLYLGACPPSVPPISAADGVLAARSTTLSPRLRSGDTCAFHREATVP